MYRTYYGPVIKSIYEHIVKPAARLLAHGEDESSLNQGIRKFFHVDEREVYFAKAKRHFTIPGKEWLHGSPLYLGYTGKPRRIARGEGCVIRFDSNWPNRIELEFNEVVFVMTEESWKTIEDWVEIVA